MAPDTSAWLVCGTIPLLVIRVLHSKAPKHDAIMGKYFGGPLQPKEQQEPIGIMRFGWLLFFTGAYSTITGWENCLYRFERVCVSYIVFHVRKVLRLERFVSLVLLLDLMPQYSANLHPLHHGVAPTLKRRTTDVVATSISI